MVVKAMWWNLKRLVLYLYNRLRVDFATFALVTQALPAYQCKLNKLLDDLRKGQASALRGEQVPIKKAWQALHKQEIVGTYDTKPGEWTCSCGHQKYHSYLLCKHLVKAVDFPSPDWWPTVVRCHVPPFYNVYKLLSAADRLNAPEPEELGEHSWLARMSGVPVGANALAVSPLPVCLVHL